jgi:actin-like ATPase involved in cell morphogenesis
MTSCGASTRGRGYCLGVDLGTTFVAAAVARADQVTMAGLGDRSVVMPSVVYARDDGALVTGESAGRRVVSHPDRVAAEIKRRLGDPTPLLLGGSAYSVTDLLGTLLRDVLDRVAAEQGGPPESVMLTHPANWGPHQQTLFAEVARSAGAANWRTVTEPEAAAAHYAATRPMAVGEVIAVYDFGGGTFDATVLGRTEHGIEVLGTPQGIERLGGADLDEAILSFVNHASGGALTALDLRDPSTVVALARLRQDCVLAKEALSLDVEATIPVFLPGRHLEVELSRTQLEDLIRAQVESTITALSSALQSASITPDRLSTVLLVGGSSQIPLVGRLIEERLGCRTVVDEHPKHAVALGAAALARAAGGTGSGAPVLPLFPEHVPAAGNHVPAAGNRVTAAGNRVTAAGNHVTDPGNHVTAAGNHVTDPGDRAPETQLTTVGRIPAARGPAAEGTTGAATGAATPGRHRRGIAIAASLLLLAGAATGLGVSLPQSGTGSLQQAAAQQQPAGAAPTGGSPEPAPVATPAVVLPSDVPGLVNAVTADNSLAGAQTQPLVAQLNAVTAGTGEARRQAALGALGIVGGTGVRPELASAVTTAVTPFTVLNTPADMIADLEPNPALGGPNAFRVLGCMQEFRGHTPQQQQSESQEILELLPTWSANGGVRADLVEATVRIVTPVAQGQKSFSDVETG